MLHNAIYSSWILLTNNLIYFCMKTFQEFTKELGNINTDLFQRIVSQHRENFRKLLRKIISSENIEPDLLRDLKELVRSLAKETPFSSEKDVDVVMRPSSDNGGAE